MNRSILQKGLLLFFLLCVCKLQSQRTYKDLSFSVTVPSVISYEGPGYVTLTFSYSGQGEACLPSVVQVIQFSAPSGWKKRYEVMLVAGPAYPYTIKAGEQKEIRFNLHEYFSEITSGRSKVPFKLNLSVKINNEKSLWQVYDTLDVTIAGQSVKTAEAFVELQQKKIAGEAGWTKRIALYKELLFMHFDDPALIKSFSACLRDPKVDEIQRQCKERIAEIAVKFNRVDSLFSIIMQKGNEDDRVIFAVMNGNGVQFSAAQIRMLLDHPNPWIQLYTLNYCNVPDRQAELQRLGEKLNRLNEEYKKLKEGNKE